MNASCRLLFGSPGADRMFEFGPTADAVRRDVGAPLHVQISDAIRVRIMSGEWAAHHRLPPEPQVAEEIGVSRGTLRRALATLSHEGLLQQIPGRGTFVSEQDGTTHPDQLLSTIAEDFADQGVDLRTRVILSVVESVKPGVARSLGILPGTPVFRLVRVRSAEGQPVALLHNYVLADRVPGIESLDFTATTLFGALESRFQLEIASARRSFQALAAPRDVARELALPKGYPVQYFSQCSYLIDQTPIEYSDVWIDSRSLRVVTTLSRRILEYEMAVMA